MTDTVVIIVSYNTRALTLQAVAAARKAAAGLDARVVVADNGSDGTAQGILEKGLVHSKGERAVLWHQDATPQRVVGTLTLE